MLIFSLRLNLEYLQQSCLLPPPSSFSSSLSTSVINSSPLIDKMMSSFDQGDSADKGLDYDSSLFNEIPPEDVSWRDGVQECNAPF
jgi:hypothetical protein